MIYANGNNYLTKIKWMIRLFSDFLRIGGIYCAVKTDNVEKIIPKDSSILFCITYHEVQKKIPQYLKGLNLFVREKTFKKQIKFLTENFNCISPNHITDKIDNGKANILITFDDGFSGIYYSALPILLNNRCPAICFLSTDYVEKKNVQWRLALKLLISLIGEENIRQKLLEIGISVPEKRNLMDWTKQNYNFCISERINQLIKEYNLNYVYEKAFLTWDDVREMRKKNIYFGLHTCSHPVMGRLTYKQQEREISESIKIFREKLGCDPAGYAHPFGDEGSFNKDTLELIQKYMPGTAIFNIGHGINKIGQRSMHFKRFCIHDWGIPYLLYMMRYNYNTQNEKRDKHKNQK